MDQQSMQYITSLQTVAATNPQEMALQSLCKQLIKMRIFKGFYLERRYIEEIKGYRDVVSLQKSEKNLEKLLIDIRDKVKLFYSYQKPNMWIGITSGPLTGINNPTATALETYLWVELNDLAFIEYWFRIQSIRFRDNEVIIKLKVVQPVGREEAPQCLPSLTTFEATCDKNNTSSDSSNTNPKYVAASEKQITYNDFVLLLQHWRTSIKQTVYDFLAEDINKDNIKGFLRFVSLLIVAIISAAAVGLKTFGELTLKLLFEISRLTRALTPIILKLIDVFSKIIGGFFILLAMIWKDTIVNRNPPKHHAIEYNPKMYGQYGARQRRPPRRVVKL